MSSVRMLLSSSYSGWAFWSKFHMLRVHLHQRDSAGYNDIDHGSIDSVPSGIILERTTNICAAEIAYKFSKKTCPLFVPYDQLVSKISLYRFVRARQLINPLPHQYRVRIFLCEFIPFFFPQYISSCGMMMADRLYFDDDNRVSFRFVLLTQKSHNVCE